MLTSSPARVACALCLTAAALASPLPEQKDPLSIHQSVPRRSEPGPAHLANAHRKYKGIIPRDIALALTNSDLVASPEPYDSRYLSPVNIGGQILNLNVDTGSADLWVFSTELSSFDASGHVLYDPTKSSTSRLLDGYTWAVTYADGSSASGNVYTDSVTIDNVTVGDQAIQLAQQVSSQFQQDTELDGMLGLAFGTRNTVHPTNQLTFLETAIQEAAIQEKLFTADLKKGQPGSYDFGYIDSSKYTGSISYSAVDNSAGYWQITGTGYGVGDGSLQSATFNAIVDTGTSLLILDDNFVETYWNGVSGASYDSTQSAYTFPCTSTLPDVHVGFGTYTAVVPGSYLNFAALTSTTCYGGLQSNTGLGFSILGDVFLTSQFVVFDYGNIQVGFATKDLNLSSSPAEIVTTTTSSTTISSISSSSTYSSTSTTSASKFTFPPFANSSATTSTTFGQPSGSFLPSQVFQPTPTAGFASFTPSMGPWGSWSSSTSWSRSYDDGMWHTTYNQEWTATPSMSFPTNGPAQLSTFPAGSFATFVPGELSSFTTSGLFSSITPTAALVSTTTFSPEGAPIFAADTISLSVSLSSPTSNTTYPSTTYTPPASISTVYVTITAAIFNGSVILDPSAPPAFSALSQSPASTIATTTSALFTLTGFGTPTTFSTATRAVPNMSSTTALPTYLGFDADMA